MSDVIQDKTNAEVVIELRSASNDDQLQAGIRYLLTTAASRIEALTRLLEMEREA